MRVVKEVKNRINGLPTDNKEILVVNKESTEEWLKA